MDKNLLKNLSNAFLVAELDNDIIGICKSIVDFMQEIRKLVDPENLETPEDPKDFFKIDPHLPRNELRERFRNTLKFLVLTEDMDEQTRLLNLYVFLLAASYFYNFPIKEMINRSEDYSFFFRNESLEMLLNDKMSPNWITEPSGKDFSKYLIV